MSDDKPPIGERLADSSFVHKFVAPKVLRPISRLYQERFAPPEEREHPEGREHDDGIAAVAAVAVKPEPEPEPEPETRAQRAKDVALTVKDRVKADNLVVQAAGIAFYSLLAIPALLAATLSIAGLALDPATVAQQVEDNLSGLPDDARSIIADQLEAVSGGASGGLILGVALGIVLALWSVSGAMTKLMATLNTIYAVDEDRNFLALRGTALVLTFGGIFFIVAAVFALAVVPPLLGETTIGDAGRWLVNIARFPVLAVAMVVGLGVLYRYGPNRRGERHRTFTVGATVATLMWLALSGLFTVYTSTFGNYNQTYGALAGVVILLMWLWITALVVLVGAEVNAVRAGVRPSTSRSRSG